MKASPVKTFEKGNKRLRYNTETNVVKVWAPDLASAKEFLMEQMDGSKVGVVEAVVVTLTYEPKVSFLIRGKHLFPFVQSDMNERPSYRRSQAFAKQENPNPSKIEQRPAMVMLDQRVQLVVYCTHTGQFLMDRTDPSGDVRVFPAVLACASDNLEDLALRLLVTVVGRSETRKGSPISRKHLKKFNEVDTVGVKHHFFLAVFHQEFSPAVATASWVDPENSTLSWLANLLITEDPTIRQLIEKQDKPEKTGPSELEGVDD